LRQEIEALIAARQGKASVRLLDGQAQHAIRAADLVLLASGTASLETMLLGKPMVICYKVAPLTYALASRILKVPYVGLPNLLAGEMLVPEYMQHEATTENLFGEIQRFLADPGSWDGRLHRFEQMRQSIARQANRRAAEAVLGLLGSP
jgi:lipid-A-disaccharide synthase